MGQRIPLKRAFLSCVLGISWMVPSFAADQLTIISPHRKSIQSEYIPLFEAYYKKTYNQDIKVDWIDQGGSENDLRFVDTKFKQSPDNVGIDVFWGGGDLTFHDLEKRGFLEKLPKELTQLLQESVVGAPLVSKTGAWIGTAVSSFGIFYNKPIFKMQGIAEPMTWDDLGNPSLVNLVSVADPRKSGTSLVMNYLILKSQSWEKGWESLTRIAANTRAFTLSSSDPIKDVVTGDAAVATAVDFYAISKIGEIGAQNLGFVMPLGKTVFNSDPVGILKGTKNKVAAERFVKFLLTDEAQRLLVLKQGAPQGPKQGVLGRMAVLASAYEVNDKSQIVSPNPFKMDQLVMKFDLDQMTAQKEVLSDLIGAIHCDTHKELQTAWKAVLARGSKPDEWKILMTPPITQAEFEALGKVWGDQVLRNKTINQWINSAKSRYITLSQTKNS